jgi:biotin operon repressor
MPKTITAAIAEEAGRLDVDPQWPAARRLRHALLHGETFTGPQVAERFGFSPSMLSQCATALTKAGYQVDKTRVPDQGNAVAVTVRGKLGVGSALVSKRKPRRDRGELDRLRALHAPAPAALDLGAVLRCVMVAEHDGEAVAVLADADGRRYFVKLDGVEQSTESQPPSL